MRYSKVKTDVKAHSILSKIIFDEVFKSKTESTKNKQIDIIIKIIIAKSKLGLFVKSYNLFLKLIPLFLSVI